MTMKDVQLDALQNRPLLIAQIAGMAGMIDGLDRPRYWAELERIAGRGARIAWIQDMHRLVACMTWVPIIHYQPALDHRQEIEVLTGVPLEQCVMRSTVHVHPRYRGKGHIRAVEAACNVDAVTHGYSHGVAYGYATESAWIWFSSRPNAQVTDLRPTDGEWPMVIEPLAPACAVDPGNTSEGQRRQGQ